MPSNNPPCVYCRGCCRPWCMPGNGCAARLWGCCGAHSWCCTSAFSRANGGVQREPVTQARTRRCVWLPGISFSLQSAAQCN